MTGTYNIASQAIEARRAGGIVQIRCLGGSGRAVGSRRAGFIL